MVIKKGGFLILLFSIVLSMLMALGFSNLASANGNPGAGVDQGANNGIHSSWQVLEGGGGPPSAAWNAFYAKFQNKKFDSGVPGKYWNIEQFMAQLTIKSADKSITNMMETCMNSEHIFWYGDNANDWKSKAGKNNIGQPAGMSPAAAADWVNYVSQPIEDSGWGESPGPVIVCSAAVNTAKEVELVFVPDSNWFWYDGSEKRITTWQWGTGARPEPGDSVTPTALGTGVEVGAYPVYMTAINLVQTSNTKYTLTSLQGTLTILKEVSTSDLYRCLSLPGSDSIEAIVLNKMLISPALDPSGKLSSLDKEKNAKAFSLMNNPPVVGDTKDAWTAWKNQIIPIKDDKEVKINTSSVSIGGESFASIFSQYGGVLDVALTHEQKGYEATFCQPQSRSYFVASDGKGGFFISYTPWVNSGPIEIETIGSYVPDPILGSYQILGMNCNHEAYMAAKGASNVDSSKESTDWKGRIVSGVFKTKLVENAHVFPLGRSIGGNMNDYIDSPTCKTNGLCTVAKTSSSNNDSHNNQLEIPLFQEVEQDKFLPTDKADPTKGKLTMFRDYEERIARPDVWHLRGTSSGLISSETAGAVRTHVQIFDGFTPEYDITVVKTNGTPDAEKFTAPGITVLNGHQNRFVFKSQWASLDTKPYKLGTNWVYHINGQRSIINTVSNLSVGMNTATTVNIEVGCQFLTSPSYEVDAAINKQPHVNSLKKLPDSLLQWSEDQSTKVIFSRGVSNRRD